MSRSTKKILYGALYLVIFTLIGASVLRAVVPEQVSCTDGKQNQGETGVDCGGPCVPCAILHLKPLEVVGSPRVFGLSSGRAVLLAEVFNPNTEYAAEEFVYRLELYDSSDSLLEIVKGAERLDAREKKFIYNPDISSPFEKITRIEARLSDPQWQMEGITLQPVISLQDMTTELGENGIEVRGTLKNNSAFPVGEVKVTALLFDTQGGEVFASQTLITDLEGFGARMFIVFIPPDPQLMQRVHSSATKVYISAR